MSKRAHTDDVGSVPLSTLLPDNAEAVTEMDADDVTARSPASVADQQSLRCIFAWLTLRDVCVAYRINRVWAAAIRAMPPLGVTYGSPCAHGSVVGIVRPCMAARHISGLGTAKNALHSTNDTLYLLSMGSLPNLTYIDGSLELTRGMDVVFPWTLKTLILDFYGHNTQTSSVDDAIRALCLLPSLTRCELTTTTCLSPRVTRFVDFRPLSQLSKLETLTLRLSHGLTISQLKQIMRLPQQGLVLCLGHCWTVEHLHTILEPRATPLTWKSVHRTLTPLVLGDDDISSLLPDRLPALTSLCIAAPTCDFLARLTKLADLDITLFGYTEDPAPDQLPMCVRGLQGCTNLTSLVLRSSHFRATDLTQICGRMPLLSSFELRSEIALHSLDWVASLPETLHEFRVGLAHHVHTHLTEGEIAHLYRFKQLRHLALHYGFTYLSSAIADDVSVLRSTKFPALRTSVVTYNLVQASFVAN